MNVNLIAATRNRLQQKLHPQRFPGMTRLMAALVGFILDASFVRPRINEVAVTLDGFVVVCSTGNDAMNHLIGTYQDLLQNWLTLLAGAGLTTAEREEADVLFATKIGHFGRTTA